MEKQESGKQAGKFTWERYVNKDNMKDGGKNALFLTEASKPAIGHVHLPPSRVLLTDPSHTPKKQLGPYMSSSFFCSLEVFFFFFF